MTTPAFAVAVALLVALLGPSQQAGATLPSKAASKGDLLAEINQLIDSDPTLSSLVVGQQKVAAVEHGRDLSRGASTDAVRPDAVQTQALKVGPGYLLKAGKYHTVSRKTLAGSYVLDGRIFVCIAYNALGPNGPRVKGTIKTLLQQMPSETAAKQAFTAWNQFGDDLQRTRSKRLAAALWVALNYLTKDKKFLADLGTGKGNDYKVQLKDIDDGVLPLADKILEFSRAYGPFKHGLMVPASAVGQTVLATFTLRSAKGLPVPGQPVTFNVNSQGSLTSDRTVKTNAAGQAKVLVRRTGTAQLNVQVNYSAPSWSTSTLNKPSKGHQLGVVAGSALFKGQVRATSTLTAMKVNASVRCVPNCDGVGAIPWNADNRSGVLPGKGMLLDSRGRLLTSVIVPAGTVKAGPTIKLPDGTKGIIRAFCYVNANGGCITSVVKFPGAFEVVCPAWPKLTYTVECDCPEPGKALVDKVSFGASIKGSRYYEFYVGVNGVVTKVNGKGGEKPSLPTINAKKGDKVKVTFRAFKDAAHKQPLGPVGELFNDTWRT